MLMCWALRGLRFLFRRAQHFFLRVACNLWNVMFHFVSTKLTQRFPSCSCFEFCIYLELCTLLWIKQNDKLHCDPGVRGVWSIPAACLGNSRCWVNDHRTWGGLPGLLALLSVVTWIYLVLIESLSSRVLFFHHEYLGDYPKGTCMYSQIHVSPLGAAATSPGTPHSLHASQRHGYAVPCSREGK